MSYSQLAMNCKKQLPYILYLLIIGGIWTVSVIHFSSRAGRLAHEAAYDDCLYMYDGYWRIDLMDREGILSALESFVTSFPHSPWCSMQSFVAFQLFGVNDTAPYWFHLGPLVLFLGLTLFFVPSQLRLIRYLLPFVALSFQVSFIIVHEFRPDPSYGLLIAFAITLAVMAVCQQRQGLRYWIGCAYFMLALSIYVKPTFFLNTFFIVGILTSSLVGHQWFVFVAGSADKGGGCRFRSSLKQSVNILWLPLLIFIGVIMPLLVLKLDYFYEYMMRNAFGTEKEIWRIEGGPVAAFQFFTTGSGGMQMMGKSLYSALLLFLLGMALLIVNKNRNGLLAVAWLSLMTFAALFVMIAGQLNTPFFGLTFHFLLIATGMAAFLNGIHFCRRWERWMAIAVLLCVVLWNINNFQSSMEYSYPRFYRDNRVFGTAHKQHGIAQEMIGVLKEEVSVRNGENQRARIYVGFVASISTGTLRWMSAKEGIDLNLEFYGHDRNEGFEQIVSDMDQYDYVIIAEMHAPEIYNYLPVNQHHAPLEAFVRKSERYELISRWDTYADGGYSIYKIIHERPHTLSPQPFLNTN